MRAPSPVGFRRTQPTRVRAARGRRRLRRPEDRGAVCGERGRVSFASGGVSFVRGGASRAPIFPSRMCPSCVRRRHARIRFPVPRPSARSTRARALIARMGVVLAAPRSSLCAGRRRLISRRARPRGGRPRFAGARASLTGPERKLTGLRAKLNGPRGPLACDDRVKRLLENPRIRRSSTSAVSRALRSRAPTRSGRGTLLREPRAREGRGSLSAGGPPRR
jgi:hypothetical protein